MTTSTTLTKISLGVVVLGLLAVTGAFLFAPKAQAVSSLSSLSSGDLIRGTSLSAVYYLGADGLRYVFTTDRSYFTWYSNFDTVKTLSDADLSTLQLGGNVTYKPGVKMVKINTDPRTYAVAAGGTLRHVGSEALAVSLYGSDWNTKIDDVADGFFTNYVIGDPIADASDYSTTGEMSAATSINADKDLVAPEEIDIASSGYSPIDVTITAGQSIRFTNIDSEKHTVTGDDLSWGSGTMQAGGVFIKTFRDAGTYTFFDSYDSSNTGAVYVE